MERPWRPVRRRLARALGYEEGRLSPYAVAAFSTTCTRPKKHGVERIKTVQNYADAQYMRLSPVTRANL